MGIRLPTETFKHLCLAHGTGLSPSSTRRSLRLQEGTMPNSVCVHKAWSTLQAAQPPRCSQNTQPL